MAKTKKKTAKKTAKKTSKKAAKSAAKKTAKKAAKKTAKKVAKKKVTKKVAKKVAKKKVAKKVSKKTVSKKTSKKATSAKPKKELKKDIKKVISPKAEKEAAKPTKAKGNEADLLESAVDLDALDYTEFLEENPWADSDPEDVVLTDAEGNPYCKVKDCDQLAAVDGYCRYHYILLWKRIQNRKKILAGGKLDRYIEELTARYPDKYLEMLRKDLASEKDFLAVVAELDIDESLNDSEFDDDSENYIDEMRGVTREESEDDF